MDDDKKPPSEGPSGVLKKAGHRFGFVIMGKRHGGLLFSNSM
jgi:hypothetical protein